MKRVIITGANGQLGADIVQHMAKCVDDVLQLSHTQIDITDKFAVENLIKEYKPDVFINTAAYHHVDLCEDHPDLAISVNATAPAYIAELSAINKFKFVHFSTDYVFDGSKSSPYNESDITNPLNQYGISKSIGEQQILEANPDSLILRVSALYGIQPCRAKKGLNFVKLMLKLAKDRGEVKVVNDEFVSPTSTESIAHMLPRLLVNDLNGIVHLTAEGACSWYEFAEEIFKQTKTNVILMVATSDDFPAKTNRPKYSVLENRILKEANMNDMPHWKESLQRYLKYNL